MVTTGVALPALHRAFVETVRRDGGAAALHACACFAEQLLADAAAAHREAAPGPDEDGTGARLAASVVRLRELCTGLAREMAASADAAEPAWSGRAAAAAAPDGAERRIAVVEDALALATAVTGALWGSAAARRDERTAALLRHAADWKTPECYGYDLADPELCYGQAAERLSARSRRAPVLVVGIRTGGSYLAPFWQAAAEDAGVAAGPWHSVRPVRGGAGITLPGSEIEALPRRLPPGAALVLVDDQPDTGATALAVRDRVARRYPGVRDVVLAAPGRLYDLSGPAVRPLAERPVVRPAARLWQLAGTGGAAALAARARAAGVPLAPGAAHRVEPFRGPFLAEYGPGTAPRGGAAGARGSGAARRLDPRNRPFSLVAGATGAGTSGGTGTPETYHFRFIGTGPHGLHCHQALRALGDLLPPGHVFADGYLVTRHEHGLRPLRAVLPELEEPRRRRVLLAVAESWAALRRVGELGRPGGGAGYEPRARLDGALRRLRERMGRPLPVDGAWTARHVPERMPLGGADGVLLRTPLPYGHGYWHWQLADTGQGGAGPAGGGAPVLRRFGLDWIWGGGGCLESEIASFVVENRLGAHDRDLLREAVAAACGGTRAFDAGLRLAGEALYWNAKTWLRRCPVVTPATADRIEAELAAQAAYVAALA
ncbi:Neamine phosphoribosyltransferase [Streptomyces rubrolavendulae]|uniref:Neamine phosphoribosyltransferase n=1 Tax=Streptomyces rubrolavendulae TaxID=285473 RepID=A0A1D8G9Y9_9ACTN|nr:Neamine phosphoribosyltransferase [Streptomyces rubrolavendulae]